MTKQEIAINNIRTNANIALLIVDNLRVDSIKRIIGSHRLNTDLLEINSKIERVLSEVADMEVIR